MSLLLTPRRLTSSRVAPKAVRYACHAAKGNDSSRHRRSLACARRRIRGDRPRKSSGWRVSQMGLRDTAPNSKRCKSVVAHRRPAPRSKQRSSSSTRFQIPMYSMAASVTRGGSKYLPSSSSARSPPPPPNLAWRHPSSRGKAAKAGDCWREATGSWTTARSGPNFAFLAFGSFI